MPTDFDRTPCLRVGAETWSRADLVGATLPADASAHTLAAFEFCAAWLRGDPSTVVQTSGSTGAPKPTVLSRAQMEASARATGAALALREGMESLVCLPARYIAGRMMLVRGLVFKMVSTLVEPAANPLALLGERPIDFAAFVPLQIESILEAGQQARLEAMQAILVGGAPLGSRLEQALRSLSVSIYHTYGMTETATHVALRRVSGGAADDRFVPLPGETRLDERGCLALRGPMTDGAWIVTNDVVDRRDDGSFVWRGRADNVINSGGIKIQVEPLEEAIEPLLADLDGWSGRRFVVAGLPDSRLGQIVALVVEGPALPAANQESLLETLRRALGPYERPRLIRFLPRFAETPTAKIDRPATLRLLTAQA